MIRSKYIINSVIYVKKKKKQKTITEIKIKEKKKFKDGKSQRIQLHASRLSKITGKMNNKLLTLLKC